GRCMEQRTRSRSEGRVTIIETHRNRCRDGQKSTIDDIELHTDFGVSAYGRHNHHRWLNLTVSICVYSWLGGVIAIESKIRTWENRTSAGTDVWQLIQERIQWTLRTA